MQLRTPLYLLQPLDRRRRLFSALGVEWAGTPLWWLSPIWLVAFGVALGLAFAPADTSGQRATIGLGYGVLIVASVVWHSVCQIAGGHLAGAPMRRNVLTASLPVNEYEDDRDYPSRVHVMRALGGPFGNLLLGLAALLLDAVAGPSHYFVLVAVVNFAFAAASMVPLPGMDGASALHESRHWRPAR